MVHIPTGTLIKPVSGEEMRGSGVWVDPSRLEAVIPHMVFEDRDAPVLKVWLYVEVWTHSGRNFYVPGAAEDFQRDVAGREMSE